MTAADRDDEGSRLCLACGLCCNGAVFSFVPVEPEEMGRLHTRLPVVHEPHEAEPHFSLPCAAHRGTAGCGLYRERPSVCSSYACRQLSGVTSGEIPIDEALAKVGELRRLFERLDRVLPPGGWIWSRVAELRRAAPPEAAEERRRHAETLLDLKLLELRVARDLDERIGRKTPPRPGDG